MPILKRLRPAHKIIISFLALILIGGFLLCLPISSKNMRWGSVFDSLFTSTSAVCVVGLSPLSLGIDFSIFGQIVILFLIQIGGLGFMTITTFIMMIAGKKITLKDRIALRESLNQENTKGIVKLVRHIFVLTFSLELLGALIMMPVFIIDNGAIGIWQAVFTSVSAFCNAGFEILGTQSDKFIGLTGYTGNVVISLTVSFLVIVGSLGFMVITDIIKNKANFKRLSLQSKVVLSMTFWLVIFGFVAFFVFEYSNKSTLGNKSFGTKLLASFFESVNCRSSGFTTFNNQFLSAPSRVLSDIYMLIGASPGSTGGGIKTTTVAVLILTLNTAFRNRETLVVGKKSINFKVVLKAVSITVFSVIMICITLLLLLFIETNNSALTAEGFNNYESMLHLSIASFSNAGMYTDMVPFVSIGGQVVLLLSMFIGRIGIITMGFVFFNKGGDLIKYPDGNIIIG